MSYRESIYNTDNNEIIIKIKLHYPLFYHHIINSANFNNFINDFKGWLLSRKEKFHLIESNQQKAIEHCLILLANEGSKFEDPQNNGEFIISKPFHILWSLIRRGENEASTDFYFDMFHLLEQLYYTKSYNSPTKEELIDKMNSLPKGTDKEIIAQRQGSKNRIIRAIVHIIETRTSNNKYAFPKGLSSQKKTALVNQWWNDYRFHLHFAVRNTEQLNALTGNKLPKNVIQNFEKGNQKGIPIFINPYYLSLLNIEAINTPQQLDKCISDYIFFSDDLISSFGKIKSWEKEDELEEGKANAAGWILPKGDSVHRRYPQVAIFMPKGSGRSCAGLCVSCQRMYGFQKGQLNFSTKQSKTTECNRKEVMSYFANDTQLRDILITGGDTLMNSNASLKKILDDVLKMIQEKHLLWQSSHSKNKPLPIQRVRIGTRIPAYLPQRINNELSSLLYQFKIKAKKYGVDQFIIQTHFESAMELTPEVSKAIEILQSSQWLISNQHVFTLASSRRTHSMQLRRELNLLGIVPYYTFVVKGFNENKANYAPVARIVQEHWEEKQMGIPQNNYSKILYRNPEDNARILKDILQKESIPFFASDRSIINLPALGKSLSFQQIGISADGRRILQFTHDKKRQHSPRVHENDSVIIIETKSIAAYLRQLALMGENVNDYKGIYTYSSSITEDINPLFLYPKEKSSIKSQNYIHNIRK